jgi:hypothetical protein
MAFVAEYYLSQLKYHSPDPHVFFAVPALKLSRSGTLVATTPIRSTNTPRWSTIEKPLGTQNYTNRLKLCSKTFPRNNI